MKVAVLCVLASALFLPVSRAQVPVFDLTQADSSIKFNVKASVSIAGTFDKWDSNLTFTSPELTSAVLDIKIQAGSVNTGSGMKDGKLKIFDKGIEWKDGQPVIRQTAESTLFFPEMEPLREELAHFVDCVRTRKSPRTDGANGVRVLRVLDACQRSIESGGQPVRL